MKQSQEVKIIKDRFFKLAAHSYLNQCIGKIEPDPDIILFLLEILKDSYLSLEEQREQILSALFVQTAFSAHESVRVDNIEGFDEKKPRQLTVLAGDFFSSLYYLMLVKKVHASILPVFSSSIQEMNEGKMKLHFFRYQSKKDLVETLHITESGLITNIATHYHKEELGSLAKTFFLLKRLDGERRKKRIKYLSSFATAIYHYVEGVKDHTVTDWPSERTMEFVEDEIIEQMLQLRTEIEMYPSIQDTPLYDRMEEWMTALHGVTMGNERRDR